MPRQEIRHVAVAELFAPGLVEALHRNVGGRVGDQHVEGLGRDRDRVAAHDGQLVHLLHRAEAGAQHLAAVARAVSGV